MTGHITLDPDDPRQVEAVNAVVRSLRWSRDLATEVLAALRDLPPEPPQPPEPTEPGTVVWDRDGLVWQLDQDGRWFGYPNGAYTEQHWHTLRGPLTTRQPGTIPAEAVADDRAEELAEAMTGVYGIAGGSLPGAIRFLLARIRDWQPT